jgi:hypothetical protein
MERVMKRLPPQKSPGWASIVRYDLFNGNPASITQKCVRNFILQQLLHVISRLQLISHVQISALDYASDNFRHVHNHIEQIDPAWKQSIHVLFTPTTSAEKMITGWARPLTDMLIEYLIPAIVVKPFDTRFGPTDLWWNHHRHDSSIIEEDAEATAVVVLATDTSWLGRASDVTENEYWLCPDPEHKMCICPCKQRHIRATYSDHYMHHRHWLIQFVSDKRLHSRLFPLQNSPLISIEEWSEPIGQATNTVQQRLVILFNPLSNEPPIAVDLILPPLVCSMTTANRSSSMLRAWDEQPLTQEEIVPLTRT